MGKDVSDVIGEALGKAAREAVQNVSKSARKRSGGSLANSKGVAAGAAGIGLLALAPLAAKGVSKAVSGVADKGSDQLKKAGDKVTDKVKGEVMDAIPGSSLFSKSGGGGGLFSSGDDDSDGDGGGKSKGVPGVGKGRRMPVQQDIDIGVPISIVYNQWTQFEEWPEFMHRVTQVSQEDESHVSFKTKIWGKSKEFKAEIVEQRPDERIKWQVTEGVTHTGVVTFHELGPRLTRVEVNLDVEPGSLIEKAGRGMRHVKRAVRADLARFKAYVLMHEEASGEWRGHIEDGEVKKGTESKSRSSVRRRRSASNGSSRSSDGSSRSSDGGGRSSSARGRAASGRARSSNNSGSSSSSSSRRRSGSRS